MGRKHAFPAMFFIINERLRSPPYGTMFCAAPFLSPHPAPSFPPSPFPQPVNQWSWLSPDGRQAVSHQQWKRGLILCLSLLLFMPPCLLKFFHLMVSVASLGPPRSPPSPLSLYSLCFPLWKSQLWPASAWRRVNFFKHDCGGAIRHGCLDLGVEGPVSLINKSDLVLTGLCICPLSVWWINMSRVGAGTAWG